jgi:mannose-6-phosphate isomerase-like protein (cupin superfamily)
MRLTHSTAIRRVVTGHQPNGQSLILEDGPLPSVIELGHLPGVVFHEIWASPSTPQPLGCGPVEDPTLAPLSLPPPAQGTRIRIVDLPPESEEFLALCRRHKEQAFKEVGDSQASTARAAASHPLMHRTESLDYGVVLEGEVTLIVDQSEVQLQAGAVIVQRGTNHAWSNRSGKPCRMLFVLQAGQFDAALGSALQGPA